MAALRQRAIDLERERDQSIRLATQEERAKIARDIHDIVAHSLSVIVVQADGGAYLLTMKRPAISRPDCQPVGRPSTRSLRRPVTPLTRLDVSSVCCVTTMLARSCPPLRALTTSPTSSGR